MIHKGSTVKIHYTLTVDGRVVDSSLGHEPLTYVQGASQIISGLEEQLEGLEPGTKKQVTVAPEKAYGVPDDNAVYRVPRSAFKPGEELKVGDVVSGQVGGRDFQAVVDSIEPEEVTLNLNHPLAGKTLHFDVEVVEAS